MRAPNPKSILVILTSRGGGDRPPVVALACGLLDRGHRVAVLCDVETAQLIASTGPPTITFPPALHGKRGYITRWITRLKEADGEPDGDWPNPIFEWANPLMPSSLKVIPEFKPGLIISSLFTIGLAEQLSAHSGRPWCFVNPSFYCGDYATSDWEEDFCGRFLSRCVRDCIFPLTKQADIVLHATDPEFDFQPTQLPKNHYYVGFLIWEPQTEGVAQVVPRAHANPEQVERAVTAVFDGPQYRKAAAFHSERLEAIDSVAVACRLLEEM